VSEHIFADPPDYCQSDWTMAQNWGAFKAEDHHRWQNLLARQSRLVKAYAPAIFLEGMNLLPDARDGIPHFDELNHVLMKETGWQVVAVPGWIPNKPFFEHIANRRFPVANFLRTAESGAYNDEPDMFHDLFGHIPMLADPRFRDFLVAYGNAGLRAERLDAADYLGRLWLYTVEFGLILENGRVKAFGGGLLSSHAEAVHATSADDARRLRFDIPRIMRTDYHFDRFQEVYFLVSSMDELLGKTENTHFADVYRELDGLSVLAPGDQLPSDQDYAITTAG
jgi:phenylalanine-4-hydroxylase